MTIVYTLTKKEDNHIIEVQQDTTITIWYLSNTTQKVVTTVVKADSPYILPVNIDGEYRGTLEVVGQVSVTFTFEVIKNLQNSIIRDALTILCTTCSGNNKIKANCVSNAGKQYLKHKSIFIKLLSFEGIMLPYYGVNYPIVFTSFINKSLKGRECKLQNTVNNILQEECITGNVKDTESLFRLYVALYWAGMYFIEEELAGNDTTQIAFVKNKFYYDTISNCICNLCVSIDMLREAYSTITNYMEIYSFQFDGIEKTSMDLVTEAFLLTSATVEDSQTLLNGKQITYTKLGRVGFAIKGDENNFRLYDALGNDITDTVFNSSYEEERRVQIYLSKEYYVPSTIYYKFIKI